MRKWSLLSARALILAAILAGQLLAGCAQAPQGEGGIAGGVDVAEAKVAQSEVSRQINPPVPETDRAELATGNRAFALDFYRTARAGRGNLFYSPYSISLALAMTYAGARGETGAQMAKALHFNLPQERLHPAFNAVDQLLAGTTAPVTPAPTEAGGMQAPEPFQLRIANSLWGQQGYPFLPEFLDRLAANYGAGLRLVDFVQAPEPAREEINGWVSDQTEEKIRDLIPPGAIDTNTRLVLANAIYFKAGWLYPFDKERTQEAPFHLLDGSQAAAMMMSPSKVEDFRYLKGENYQAVELPYASGEIAMLVLVPDQGAFEAFETGLDAAGLDTLLAGMESTPVALQLPKFKVESDFQLNDALSALGMPAAFDPAQADFSGMDGKDDLYIGAALHKAFVAVDEAGTEAAAATAVVMVAKAAIDTPEPVRLTVDRPFIFLIYDHATGTILFMGRVLNPAP